MWGRAMSRDCWENRSVGADDGGGEQGPRLLQGFLSRSVHAMSINTLRIAGIRPETMLFCVSAPTWIGSA